MQFSENIIEVSGYENGPISMVLAGTHGDEKGGVRAMEKVLRSLKIGKGRVFFGYGNPRAIERNIRYTEANLNRMFKPDGSFSEGEQRSYEYRRAQFLKPYMEKADALLDLHSSFTPKSKAFIICEARAMEVAGYFPQDTVVSGFDAVQPGGTDYFMNSRGKIGICVECGYLGDESSEEVALQTIFNFLAARGHIDLKIETYPKNFIKIYKLYFSATDSFALAKEFSDFEEVAEGQVIGTDGGREVRAPEASIILFARAAFKKGEEVFYLGRKRPAL